MVGTEPLMNTLSHKIGERIFLLCDQCLWAVTCINKKYLEELSEISEVEYSCPMCKQDQLSSFPITSNNTFRYRYSKNKGVEITFTIKWYSRSALLLKFNWHIRILVKSRELLLKMEIKIEIPEDILSDKDRLKAVEQGIVKAVSKGLYEEGLAFTVVKANFD